MGPRAVRLALLAIIGLASAAAFAEPAAGGAQKGGKSKAPRPPPYVAAVRAWHAPREQPPAVDDSGRPLLVLVALNTGQREELHAGSDRGSFSGPDLDRAAGILREPQSGNAHPVEPRLLDVVYALETHFAASEIRFLSGYRTPRPRSGSNHGKGRAMDLVVPGVSDDDVASFARTLGFVGVGIYPTSGFVHVDVRERSYFWSDSSGPGKRNREHGILGSLARASDESAALRGERPVAPLLLGLDVDAALRARGQSLVAPAPGEENPSLDDDDEDVETGGP